jgi:hypothetical protein
MGVSKYTLMYFITGSKDSVKEITAYDASFLSKWSVNSKPLRYAVEQTKELLHSPLQTVYSYPDKKMWKLRTQDDYFLEVTEDVEIYTLDGWKPVSDLKIGDMIYVNGTATPPYAIREVLKKLYMDKRMSQRKIAEMYGVSERTVRFYVNKFELHRGDSGALFGVENPAYKGEYVSKDGGYSRTVREIGDKKKGVCCRCGFVGRTDIHHDDRNPVNTSEDNLLELCVMCHKAEHLGAPVRWIRPAEITEKSYAGMNCSLGFKTQADNIVANGFIVRFTDKDAVVRDIL